MKLFDYNKCVILCDFTCSSFDHDPDGIENACRLSLKNLQLDYLDLYLVHHPRAFRKGCVFANMTEEDKLGYDPERMAKIWKVRVMRV